MAPAAFYWLAWFFLAQSTTSAEVVKPVKSALVAPAVISESIELPPSNAAWVGEEPHLFMGGQARLFCGSHGVFTPRNTSSIRKGFLMPGEYNAVFKGELTLNPPLVPRSRTIEIDDPIVIAEQVTTKGAQANGTRFSTELTRVDFRGSDFPDDIRIRESHGQQSSGWKTITPLADGRFRIEAHYDVWLELSVDGGQSWALADNVVRMRLHPVTSSTRLQTREVRD